jgi:hypothetical protein
MITLRHPNVKMLLGQYLSGHITTFTETLMPLLDSKPDWVYSYLTSITSFGASKVCLATSKTGDLLVNIRIRKYLVFT